MPRFFGEVTDEIKGTRINGGDFSVTQTALI
jgi:hypothetical protein